MNVCVGVIIPLDSGRLLLTGSTWLNSFTLFIQVGTGLNQKQAAKFSLLHNVKAVQLLPQLVLFQAADKKKLDALCPLLSYMVPLRKYTPHKHLVKQVDVDGDK